MSPANGNYEAVEQRIRELARAALEEGRVDYFIGWTTGYNQSEVIPGFVRSADKVDDLVWSPLAAYNLTTFLKRKMPDPPQAKIGVAVKGCDSRTLVSLLQENLVDRERLYVVGVPCEGIVNRRAVSKVFANEVVKIEVAGDQINVTNQDGETKQLAREDYLLDHCRSCNYPNPRYFDDLAGEAVPEPEDQTPMWREIEEFEALPEKEKDRLMAEAFEKCIRCYACINACPVCYCWDNCVCRSRQPKLVGQKVNAQENLMFQMVHMFHVAGRCPSCGNCDRACPVEIPLYLLHRKMNKELKEMLDFEPGIDLEQKPVFQTFDVNDPFGQH